MESPSRIVVTGASGFIGAHTARCLAGKGAHVLAWIRPQSDPWRLRELAVGCQIIEADMESDDSVSTAMAESRPDAVLHCAWRGVGNAARNEPFQIQANLRPIVHLLQTAAMNGCKRFIGLGSQAEYGPQSGAIRETAPTEPTSLYGASKLSACHLTRIMADQLGVGFSWIRIFSTYGPLEDGAWMIPYLIRTLLRREKPSLTAAAQRWDFLFVRDAAEAIAGVVMEPTATGVYNLGSGGTSVLRDAILLIRDFIDPTLPIGFGEVPYRPDQVMHLEADVARLAAAIGWSARTSLGDGIRETVEYHRRFTAC